MLATVYCLLIHHSAFRIHHLPYSRTYSNSNGLPLMPAAGGAIQLAILPGSVTGRMRLRTYARSSSVGSNSARRPSHSSLGMRVASRSKEGPGYSPACRWERVGGHLHPGA